MALRVKPRSRRQRAPERTPRCPRCNGMLHPERFSDFSDQTGQFHFSGWRCLACGEVLDPVIMANRRQVVETEKPLLKSQRSISGKR